MTPIFDLKERKKEKEERKKERKEERKKEERKKEKKRKEGRKEEKIHRSNIVVPSDLILFLMNQYGVRNSVLTE